MPRKKIVAHVETVESIADPNDVSKKKGVRKDDAKPMDLVEGGCTVGDQQYPERASICYDGHIWTCHGGQWQGPGAAC